MPSRQRVPLPRAPVNEVLATTRVIFGTETIEYRSASETRFGAILGIKEYPTPAVVGMYDGLLSAPFPFVLDAVVHLPDEGGGAGAAAAAVQPDGRTRATSR